MTTEKIEAGFYGTQDSTYLVTPAGKTWVVQTDDLIECPKLIAALPPDATPCNDLISPPDAVDFIDQVEAEGGEKLIGED